MIANNITDRRGYNHPFAKGGYIFGKKFSGIACALLFIIKNSVSDDEQPACFCPKVFVDNTGPFALGVMANPPRGPSLASKGRTGGNPVTLIK